MLNTPFTQSSIFLDIYNHFYNAIKFTKFHHAVIFLMTFMLVRSRIYRSVF